MTAEPPPIDGVRRSFVEANGVRFHVTESGPTDGRPVLALHGWPQHHYEWRDLLSDPPPGLRIIAPDLPGYGWSGPPPHRWAKDDVATDVLALLDALGLDRVLLVAHDWGAYVGYRMVLRAPERFDGFLAMNMAHPWQIAEHRAAASVEVRLPGAAGDVRGVRATTHEIRGEGDLRHRVRPGSRGRATVRRPLPRPGVRTRGQRHLSHVPDTRNTGGARNPETRRATVPIRVLFGTRDHAVALSMVSPETANADDYTLETVDATHFVVDERPDLVRRKLIALAEETRP